MADEESEAVERLTVRQGGADEGDLAGKWLVEPAPAPDELRVIVQVGSELELSDAVRDALDQLAAALEEDDMAEVSGFAMGGLQIGLPSGAARPERPWESCTIHLCRPQKRASSGGGTAGAPAPGSAPS